ncbi:SusC/RagA family TonB-linked outer membrane protein [Pelobium manganitolerans]|uniref:SusC/RagA family TonB-linked outer membrane protein n=1 Tax=Pelobium manganitolerans TaxID=1842495 RepID=UPI003FA37101
MKSNYITKVLPRLSLLMAILWFAQPVFAVANNAMAIIVKGKVVDDEGLPLPGVSVKAKNEQSATVTDVNGNFTITVAKKTSVLVFSYLGFTTQEATVGERTIINISLQTTPSRLNEVVVVGYGTVKKGDLTGSVGQVKMEDLQKAPVKSFDEALAGRLAGVQVSSGDGQPGAGSSIVIRGQNSLTQDNSPLYVIDGFPIESSENNNINPNDIESIEVLKDASATAIYGSRGANGVIIITTKSGKKGEPTITYNGSYGFQDNIKTMDLLSAYEFVKFQQELNPSTAARLYLDSLGKTVDDYKNVQGVDRQNQLFRTAPMQQHNLSLSGGSDNTKYYISGSIDDQQGIIINSGFKRYQGKINLNQTVNNKLTFVVNSNYSNYVADGVIPTEGTNSATNNLLYSTWGYRPLSGSGYNLDETLLDPDIDGSNDYRVNPIIAAKNELRRATYNNLSVNSYAQYKFNKNLTLKISGGVTNNLRRNDRFNNSQTFYGNPFSSGGVNGVNGSVIYTQVTRWLNENTLTWRKVYNKVHDINAVAGITFQQDRGQRHGAAAIQIPNESLGINGLDEGTPQTIDAYSSVNRLSSYLARVNYGYKSKYLATLSMRADGSSKFAPGNRWSYFPSGSFAWRMSSENFMKNLTFINDAKLRLGYGVTGNNRVTDFAYLSVLGQPTGSPYAFNNAINLGAVPLELGNPDLKWESTSQTNIGYDLGVFNDRINLTADWYRKTTYDLLLNADLPYTTGYSTVFKNIGKVRNQGFEFAINTTNVKTKNFSWSSNLNISFNRSKVLELTQNQESMTSAIGWDNSFTETPLYLTKLNSPISQFYGYVFDGIYQLDEFDVAPNGSYSLKGNIVDNGNTRGSIQPGDVKYKDLNGDGTVNAKDQTVIGRGEPLHIGGFTNNFSYKNFDLNIFFQWSYGNDIYNANRMMFEGNALNKVNLNQFASYADRWTPTNPSNTIPRVRGEGPRVYSSRVIEDGSYLRLKTVSLAYNFGDDILKKLKIKSLKVFASGQNLLTFTNYSGMDPEVSVRNSALTPGFDYSAYPRARTIVFGINTSL